MRRIDPSSARGMPPGTWLLLIVLLGLAGTGRTNPLAPEMVGPADPVWADLLRLELSGALPAGVTSMRPVSRGEIAAWIAEAATRPDVDPITRARLERAFARELRRIGFPTRERETAPWIRRSGPPAPGSSVLDGARSELRIGPTLSVQGRLGKKRELGDSTRAGLYGVYLIGHSAALQGHLFVGEIEDGRQIGDALIKNTDILYWAEEVGAAIATREFRLRLARGRHRWGPGAGPTLLLDAQARPVSFLEYDLELPAGLRFRSWVGTLNRLEERGIAAHRLEIPLGQNLRFAIAEGVRFPGGPDHPLYLLGLIPYTLVQRYDERDNLADSLQADQRNNVLATAEVVWRPRAGALLFAEVLVDDIPAETAESPARLGGRIGLAVLPRIGSVPVEFRLEGTKIGRYVYAVDYGGVCECDWIHQERALGEPNGPDQEALRLTIGRYVGRDLQLELQALYANHGGGSLGEAWTAEVEELDEPTRHALTISGPVVRQRQIGLLCRWDPRDNFDVEAKASVTHVRLEDGKKTDTDLQAGLRIGWRL